MIIGTSSSSVDEELFTSVRYITKVPISDSIALRQENDLVRKEIGNIFPGFDKDKRYIIYHVVDELTMSGKAEVKHQFIHKLDGDEVKKTQ